MNKLFTPEWQGDLIFISALIFLAILGLFEYALKSGLFIIPISLAAFTVAGYLVINSYIRDKPEMSLIRGIIVSFFVIMAIGGYLILNWLYGEIFGMIFLGVSLLFFEFVDNSFFKFSHKNQDRISYDYSSYNANENNSRQFHSPGVVTISDIDNMEGDEFEEYLKKLFGKMGYSVDLTPHTGDFGADLILYKEGEKISVQAKNWTNNVGNDAIQAVVGSLKVYKTQRGIVVTTSDFTKAAIYQAHHNDVELWNREKLKDIMRKFPISK